MEYFPALHCEQVAAEPRENEPPEHMMQEDEPAAAYFPRSQDTQIEAEIPDDFPGSHAVHEATPPEE
jgi:hypothetical protein